MSTVAVPSRAAAGERRPSMRPPSKTALFEAARRWDAGAVAAILAAAPLEAGAELEAAVPMDPDEGDFRATPLWYAVARGENFALVRFLLARGADASSSLWAAVWRDDAALCRALLAAKPRLDLKAH